MAPKKAGGKQVESQSAPKRGTKRPLRRRDTEECASRIVQQHFSGWTHHDIHVASRGGETLIDRLLRLKRERAPGERISAAVISDLRREYAPAHTPLGQLRVVNADQEVEPAFRRLLCNCEQNNPAKKAQARSELVAHLAGKGEINQREVVGLLRLCGSLNPHTSTTVRHFLLEVARFLCRTNACHRYPGDCGVLRSTWDAALAAEYSQSRRDGVGRTAFYEAWRATFVLLGDVADVHALVYHRGPWVDEKERLKRVTRNSSVTQRMFAHALETTLLDDFSDRIANRMDVFRLLPVTTEAFKTAKDLGRWNGSSLTHGPQKLWRKKC